MRSRSGRSTDRRRRPRRRAGVDVFLLPAVVGGGLGDIEEVLAAGRCLARAGFPVHLYRRPGHAWPPSVRGPWEWPPHDRPSRLVARANAALTVAPAWGVSAAPRRPGALGRPGPWADEVDDLERAYGPDRVLHVSLEEFARTLRARDESWERFREGGVPARSIPERVRTADRAGETDRFRQAFARFRAFDRPNVLHLFATFRADPAFGREFPRAIQTGPLWPGHPAVGGARRRAHGRPREWVWYASPASAERLAPAVVDGLRGVRPPVRVYVRSPRPWRGVGGPGGLRVETAPVDPTAWRRRFAGADLRIVTGSRSLLEAIEVGGPFLYFNGILGAGRRARRHRPEKIVALLDVGRRAGVPAPVLRDLADFARGRRVAEIVRRRATDRRGWERFRIATLRPAFPAAYPDLGALLVEVARGLARPGASAAGVVARVRAGVSS